MKFIHSFNKYALTVPSTVLVFENKAINETQSRLEKKGNK